MLSQKNFFRQRNDQKAQMPDLLDNGNGFNGDSEDYISNNENEFDRIFNNEGLKKNESKENEQKSKNGRKFF